MSTFAVTKFIWKFISLCKNLKHLCSIYFKGPIFLIHLKVLATKYLITSEKLRDKPWPHDSIETFYMQGQDIGD
jgi:hypothetical protein